MRRMTISLLATAAIIALGAILLWLFASALLQRPSAPEPAPGAGPEPVPERTMDGALNLYLASPDGLPDGAGRIELTLVKAALAGPDGEPYVFFEGSRRLMLQPGVTEKLLSERIPNGRWTRLKLTFSPAADLAFADGRPAAAALVERAEATLSFDADVPISRTLALFARLPLEAGPEQADGMATLLLPQEPQPAERYVFGGFLLDPRDRGDIWSIEDPSLAKAVKEDLGMDITRALSGSSGFVPAAGAPDVPAPR